jgi:hypothetical protein
MVAASSVFADDDLSRLRAGSCPRVFPRQKNLSLASPVAPARADGV